MAKRAHVDRSNATNVVPSFAKAEDVATYVQKALETVRSNKVREVVRGEFSASMIGHKCARYLWYHAHKEDEVLQHATLPDGQGVRIFEFGDAVETLLCDWLERAGLRVWRSLENGKQAETRYAIDGTSFSIVGHCDGVVAFEGSDEGFVLEAKSSKEERFDVLKTDGVHESNFEHYAQLIFYLEGARSGQLHKQLGLPASLIIDRGLYVALCKNTSRIYPEIVDGYEETLAALVNRARKIARAATPPFRISPSPDKYPCKYCELAIPCHKDGRRTTSIG
jgi:hypothetical protein